MTKDPICGMTVDEEKVLSAERDGETFYFCSDSCRKKFLSAPADVKDEELMIAKTACRVLGPGLNRRNRRLVVFYQIFAGISFCSGKIVSAEKQDRTIGDHL